MSPDTEPRVLIPRTRLPADALSSQGRPPPDLLVGVSEGGVNVPAVSRSPGGVLIPAKSALEPVGVVESPTGELTLPEVMARLAAVEESKESGRQVSPQEQILFTFLPWKYLRKVAERVGWKAGTSLMPALERRFEEAELSYLFKSDKEEDIEKAFDRLETLSPTKMLAWLSHFTRMSNELIREKAKEFARRHSLSEMVTSDKKEIGIDSDFEIAAAWNADHDDSVIKPQKTSRNYGKRGGVVEVSIPSVFEQFLLEVVDDAQSIASSEPLSKKARLLKGATGIALQVADVVRYKYQTMTITAPQFVEKMATVLTTLEAAPNGESFEATWDLLSRFEIPVESAGELLAAMDKLHGLRHPLAMKLMSLLPSEHPFLQEQYRRVEKLKGMTTGYAREVVGRFDELMDVAAGIVSIFPEGIPDEPVGFDIEVTPKVVGIPLPKLVEMDHDTGIGSLPELRIVADDKSVLSYDRAWRKRLFDLWLWQQTSRAASSSFHLHVDVDKKGTPASPDRLASNSLRSSFLNILFGGELDDFRMNHVENGAQTYEVRSALESYNTTPTSRTRNQGVEFKGGYNIMNLTDFMIASTRGAIGFDFTHNPEKQQDPLKKRLATLAAISPDPVMRAAFLVNLQSPFRMRTKTATAIEISDLTSTAENSSSQEPMDWSTLRSKINELIETKVEGDESMTIYRLSEIFDNAAIEEGRPNLPMGEVVANFEEILQLVPAGPLRSQLSSLMVFEIDHFISVFNIHKSSHTQRYDWDGAVPFVTKVMTTQLTDEDRSSLDLHTIDEGVKILMALNVRGSNDEQFVPLLKLIHTLISDNGFRDSRTRDYFFSFINSFDFPESVVVPILTEAISLTDLDDKDGTSKIVQTIATITEEETRWSLVKKLIVKLNEISSNVEKDQSTFDLLKNIHHYFSQLRLSVDHQEVVGNILLENLRNKTFQYRFDFVPELLSSLVLQPALRRQLLDVISEKANAAMAIGESNSTSELLWRWKELGLDEIALEKTLPAIIDHILYRWRKQDRNLLNDAILGKINDPEKKRKAFNNFFRYSDKNLFLIGVCFASNMSLSELIDIGAMMLDKEGDVWSMSGFFKRLYTDPRALADMPTTARLLAVWVDKINDPSRSALLQDLIDEEQSAFALEVIKSMKHIPRNLYPFLLVKAQNAGGDWYEMTGDGEEDALALSQLG